jgi:hypothetical protein
MKLLQITEDANSSSGGVLCETRIAGVQYMLGATNLFLREFHGGTGDSALTLAIRPTGRASPGSRKLVATFNNGTAEQNHWQ